MNINITLDKGKLRKKGYPIIISIFVTNTDRKYPTSKYFSFIEDWDSDLQVPKKSHPLYHGIMDYILDLKLKINKLENSREKKTAEQIQNYLLGNSDSIYSFWEIRIKELKEKDSKSKKDKKGGGNSEFYENYLSGWKSYKETLLYDEINYNFLTKFKIYKSKTCNNGGINTYLKAIRAIYNEAVKRGYYKPTDIVSPFKGIMEETLPTKDKYLTLKEMNTLVKNPIEHNFYKYFMLCFYLGGLDFIDIASIKKEHIRNNRVKFVRFKGGTREVIDNYIFEEAQKIIDFFHDPDSEYITSRIAERKLIDSESA